MSPSEHNPDPPTLVDVVDRIQAAGARLTENHLNELDQADLVVGLIHVLLEAAPGAVSAVGDSAERARLAVAVVKSAFFAGRDCGSIRDAAILEALASGRWTGNGLAKHIKWDQSRVAERAAKWRKDGKLPPATTGEQTD